MYLTFRSANSAWIDPIYRLYFTKEVAIYLFLKGFEQVNDLVLQLHGHRVYELAAIRVKNLQAVVTSVRDTFYANLQRNTIYIFNIRHGLTFSLKLPSSPP